MFIVTEYAALKQKSPRLQKKSHISIWPSCALHIGLEACELHFYTMKVSKGAKIRNRYHQVPHLTHDTNGKVTNSQLDTTNESQEDSPFPAVDHKAHINRHAHSKHKTEKKILIHKRSTALERSLWLYCKHPFIYHKLTGFHIRAFVFLVLCFSIVLSICSCNCQNMVKKVLLQVSVNRSVGHFIELNAI